MDKLDGYTKEDCVTLMETAEMSPEDMEKLHAFLEKRQPKDELADSDEEVVSSSATTVEEE